MSSHRRGKRQRSNGCISDNKRTSSCQTGRRNLGTSARRSKSQQACGGTIDVDMGDACGGPCRMDGEDGLGEQGEDCGGYKAGDRNSPRDDRNLDPPCDGMDGSGDKADYATTVMASARMTISRMTISRMTISRMTTTRMVTIVIVITNLIALVTRGHACQIGRSADSFRRRRRLWLCFLWRCLPRTGLRLRIASAPSRLVSRNLCARQLELCARQGPVGLRVHMAAISPFNLVPRRTCSHPLG